MNNYFVFFMVCGFITCLTDVLFGIFLEQREAKKCNYDCSKCGNWKCYSNYCKRKRGDLN